MKTQKPKIQSVRNLRQTSKLCCERLDDRVVPTMTSVPVSFDLDPSAPGGEGSGYFQYDDSYVLPNGPSTAASSYGELQIADGTYVSLDTLIRFTDGEVSDIYMSSQFLYLADGDPSPYYIYSMEGGFVYGFSAATGLDIEQPVTAGPTTETPGAISAAFTNPTVYNKTIYDGQIRYDVDWSQVHDDAASQTLPVTDFAFAYFYRNPATYFSAWHMFTAPDVTGVVAKFEFGQPTEISFQTNTRPNLPTLDVTFANGNVVIKDAGNATVYCNAPAAVQARKAIVQFAAPPAGVSYKIDIKIDTLTNLNGFVPQRILVPVAEGIQINAGDDAVAVRDKVLDAIESKGYKVQVTDGNGRLRIVSKSGKAVYELQLTVYDGRDAQNNPVPTANLNLPTLKDADGIVVRVNGTGLTATNP